MKCSFCGKLVEKGKGLLFVRKDGKTWEFCSSKCEKNQLKLKRNPLKVKWTNKD
jgi:large subunit ribosomal protein L24e